MRHHLRAFPAVFAAAAFLHMGSPEASQRGSLPALRPLTTDDIQQWATAVRAHRPGVVDQSAIAIAKWRPEALRNLFVELSRLECLRDSVWLDRARIGGRVRFTRQLIALLQLSDPALETQSRFLKRAALLHTDIAIRVPPPFMTTAPSPFSGRVMVFLRDGEPIGSEGVATHIEFASWLLDGVAPDPTADDQVRSWYQAAAAWLQDQHRIGDTQWLMTRGLLRFPDDGLLRFYAGVVHETMATPHLQLALQSTRTGTVVFDVHTPDDEHRLALDDLQRAIGVAPGFAEARLHLGRVLGLVGRHDAAVKELSVAQSDLADLSLRYYGALFIGLEQAATGAIDEARLSFRQAQAIFPLAQSPLLAAAHLARRSGDSGGAAAALRQLLALPADRTPGDDPWWTYQDSHVRDALTRVEAWLADVAKDSAR